ncbi:MAG: hypothetical protein ACXWNK_18135 [Vulcanimicrobiaceae bacterium]
MGQLAKKLTRAAVIWNDITVARTVSFHLMPPGRTNLITQIAEMHSASANAFSLQL